MGGLYVGDDRANLVTDDKANNKSRITTQWDVKAEDIPDVEERLQPSELIKTSPEEGAGGSHKNIIWDEMIFSWLPSLPLVSLVPT